MSWNVTLRLTYHLSFFVPVEWCCVALVSSGICVNHSRTMRMIKCILTFPLARMATVTTGKDWRNYVTEILPLFIKINLELINILCIHSSVPAVQVVGWCKEMYVSEKNSEGWGRGWERRNSFSPSFFCKKSQSSLFVRDNRKWMTFHLEYDNGKIWVVSWHLCTLYCLDLFN